MNFETKLVPWIDEIQNYLKDSSKKPSDIKKVLKGVDFDKLTYADKARLYEMFDPKREITEELFKRQLDLYFSLLESKSTNIRIPVFTDYIEWVYSQDTSKMQDQTFDIVTSRLLRTKATDLPKSITSFMDRLPEAFHGDIDKLSNSRLGTLVNILNGLDADYSVLPQECKDFTIAMFNACAVKSEIADKNKNKMRPLFRDDPRYFYNILNKAFSGVGEHGSWIDEPAKKLRFKHMVDYANFQERILLGSRRQLNYPTFESYAKEMKLPKLPEYEKNSSTYLQYYLKSPREYKDYAKRMGQVFVGLVRAEMSRVEKLYDSGLVTAEDLYGFAVTDNAKNKVRGVNTFGAKRAFLSQYSNFLIDLVHLDELTGQAKSDIYSFKENEAEQKSSRTQIRQSVEMPKQKARVAETHERADSNGTETQRYYEQLGSTRKSRVEGQLSLFGAVDNSSMFRPVEKLAEETVDEKIKSSSYSVDDLPELYEMYGKSKREGRENYELAQIIVELEERQKDAKVLGEE